MMAVTVRADNEAGVRWSGSSPRATPRMRDAKCPRRSATGYESFVKLKASR